MEKLVAEKYTAADASREREPAEYVQTMLLHAKLANIDSVENQLTFAYKGISPELRAFVDPPDSNTTVSQFIAALEKKKDTWFDIQPRHHSRVSQGSSRDRDRDREPAGYKGKQPEFNSRSDSFSRPPAHASYGQPFSQGYPRFYSDYGSRNSRGEYGGSYNGPRYSNMPQYQRQYQQPPMQEQPATQQAQPAVQPPRQPLHITQGNEFGGRNF